MTGNAQESAHETVASRIGAPASSINGYYLALRAGVAGTDEPSAPSLSVLTRLHRRYDVLDEEDARTLVEGDPSEYATVSRRLLEDVREQADQDDREVAESLLQAMEDEHGGDV